MADFISVSDYLSGRTPRQAFQAAIDAAYGATGGGMITAPAGNFVFDAPVVHKGGVIMQGAGRNGGTFITSNNADVPLWQFDSTAARACLRDIFFAGRMERDAQQNVVSIAENVQVFLRDLDIWGGMAALFNKGTDCRVRDCFISGGNLACLVSNGANFYDFVKFDTYDDSKSPQWSVYLGTPTATLQSQGAMENFFNFCDMSGAWQVGSVFVDDSQSQVGPIAFTNLQSCVLSRKVQQNRGKLLRIGGGSRIGAMPVNGGGTFVIADSDALTPMTLPTSIARGSGNTNISGGIPI